ncbi:glycoside hydrolase family 17 protein [Sporormia fimetaria CBS 119925]|uniref:glucan endo-1,3-beta-D-glucosidase n=1 Tax=Sporormia fimetaria CBS 119925 TaxID=1340428 RepID=A0A6A6VE35_9PLEO|nr:glycoside hydrolase family 17 protein [Sporormia fimetaria CBS 119925]
MAAPSDHSRSYHAYSPDPPQPFAAHASSASPSQHQMPPPPPIHRVPVGGAGNHTQAQRPYGSDNYSDFSPPETTPGADNLGEAAPGGGINGIAVGVANTHERESGLQALRDVENWNRSGNGVADPLPTHASPARPTRTPFADPYRYDSQSPHQRPMHSQPSYGSGMPLAAGAAVDGHSLSTSNHSQQSLPLTNRPSPPESVSLYQDSPYNRYSSSNLQLAPHQLGAINPHDTADDDDDWGTGYQPATVHSKRRSFVSPFASSRDGSREATPGSGAAGTAAAAGVAGAATAGAAYHARDHSGNYDAVPRASGVQGGRPDLATEKSEWLAKEKSSRKRNTWIVVIVIALVCLGAILGGVLGTFLNKGGGSSTNTKSVAEDNKSALGAESEEVKELMSTNGLHKVFPGIDYTPLNAQYPECMHVKPSQNNITRDIAVLSKLTNAVRLYGTDCNQTEMVLEAIDRLGIENKMKVWLGVWLGNNQTTNDRQLKHAHKLLDKYEPERFKGVIIGNEVLYREDLTETELIDIVDEFRQQVKDKGSNMPVATSDLGDNWTADMANKVDAVMSNVHPFFAGVTADVASGWTWSFWQNHNVILTADKPEIQQIVAEVGWPTGGGNNCGGAVCASKTDGSVASVENLNTFMEDWVCPSLRNGTEYFWFSAFDEPWKIRFNEKGKEWEDKWGLMDVNRNLKKGVKIPDCGDLNFD